MTTTTIDRLPKFRNLDIQQRARDYVIGGVKYARVTSALSVIAKPALIPWARKDALEKVQAILTHPGMRDRVDYIAHASQTCPEEYDDWVYAIISDAKAQAEATKESAAEMGSQAHALIHRLLEGDATAAEEIPEDLRPAIHGAAAFLRDHQIQPIHTEYTVWDPVLRIAGTIDGVGWLDGEVAIWDWKRSKGIYPEAALQLAAYARLFELTTGLSVQDAFVVRLPQAAVADGEPLYEAKAVNDIADSWRTYETAFNLNNALKVEPWA